MEKMQIWREKKQQWNLPQICHRCLGQWKNEGREGHDTLKSTSGSSNWMEMIKNRITICNSPKLFHQIGLLSNFEQIGLLNWLFALVIKYVQTSDTCLIAIGCLRADCLFHPSCKRNCSFSQCACSTQILKEMFSQWAFHPNCQRNCSSFSNVLKKEHCNAPPFPSKQLEENWCNR